MLAHDFIRTQENVFNIIALGKSELDITDIAAVERKVQELQPDIILNCAAYTNVEEAEDAGKKVNFDINTLGVFNLAKIANEYNIDFLTISTDYVFDGNKFGWYNEEDARNPLNNYGLSKYLGETLAQEAFENTIIVRTSWLYGGIPFGKDEQNGIFKNFVNTMLKLSETRNELRVINDQFWSPTYTGDLSKALAEIIENINKFRGNIFHLCKETLETGISWHDFAKEIFLQSNKETNVIGCSSEEYKTKAVRPKFSKMKNNSNIKLQDWKIGLSDYLKQEEK